MLLSHVCWIWRQPTVCLMSVVNLSAYLKTFFLTPSGQKRLLQWESGWRTGGGWRSAACFHWPCASLWSWGCPDQSDLKSLRERSGSFRQWLSRRAEGWKRPGTAGGSRGHESARSHEVKKWINFTTGGHSARLIHPAPPAGYKLQPAECAVLYKIKAGLYCTLYFCMTSFVKPYLKQQCKNIVALF